MTISGHYIRLTLEECFLEKAFKQIEQTLEKHEEMIRELQAQLRDKASKSDLKDVHSSLSKQIETRTSELNDRISSLESRFDDRFKDIERSLEGKIAEATDTLSITMRQRMDDLESRMPRGSDSGEMGDRLKSLEETVFANGKKLQLARDSVQHVASAVALFNNSSAKLDHTLPDVLKVSVTSVTNNIQTIMEDLAKLRATVKGIEIKKARQPEPVVVERGISDNTDISSIRTYPSMVAHWRDPPDLPAIHPFMNIGDLVDYVYRMVPKLQAHLTAMHGKMVEDAADLLGKVDKTLVEKMFEKFQAVIGEMAGRVDELKDAVEMTATREEINDMVEDILSSMNHDGQTSIGRVKCIACGRDTPQVAGALTEQDALRSLGNPPNSFAYQSRAANLGVVHQTKDGFDGSIVESPRSVRPKKVVSRASTSKSARPR